MRKTLHKFAPFGLIVIIWHWISLSGLVHAMLLPAPVNVLDTALALLKNGELTFHIYVSVIRVLEGFIIAASIALVLGVSMGVSRQVNQLFQPFFQILRPIPPMAWIPLSILWFGIEENSKIFIIVIGSFFPIITNILSGMRQTENKYVELARAFEIPQKKFILKVILPGALPFIMSGLRTGLGYAWMCVVAAELSAGMAGIGYMLMDARAMNLIDQVIVAMISIGLVGWLMDMLLLKIEKALIKGKVVFKGDT